MSLPCCTFSAGLVAFNLAYDPSISPISINAAAELFQISDLHASLADFISHEQVHSAHAIHPIGGSHRASSSTSLPFEHIQVWYKPCLQTTEFHTDSILPPQTLLASSPQDDWQYRQYNIIIVNIDHSCVWPKSGLEGPFICAYHITLLEGNRALYWKVVPYHASPGEV